jgi:hypothetical protein
MSQLSERIAEHGKMLARRELDIPEWGVKAYIHPLSVEDRNQQLKTSQTDPYLAFLDVIIAACRDEDGKPLFDKQDKLTMRKQGDPRVIERIGLFVLDPYLKSEGEQ